MNKNNQTTPTKCQYQAAASNPKWWFDDKCKVMCRNKRVVRNVVPIITCSPWNPVVTKKCWSWHQRNQFNFNSIFISSLSDRLTEPEWSSFRQTTSYLHLPAVTCPKDTFRFSSVVVLWKARRKSELVHMRSMRKCSWKPNPQNTAPRSTAARSPHSTCYRPAVFFRHLRLAAPSLPRGKIQRALKLVYNCVAWNFASLAVSVHVS